jgi:two-component system KDP operon response regulator KdpE
MTHVLVVDDDPGLRHVVRDAFEREGHSVATAEDGKDALSVFTDQPFDLVVTDVAMPRLGGYELVKELRTRSHVPILVLTVRGEEAEKVRILDAGADDYVVKPFGVGELLARVRVLLRRTGAGGNPPPARFGGITVDTTARRVERDGQEVHLTPIEFGILEVLLMRPGTVCTVKQIVSAVWGEGADVSRDTIRVHVGSLRKKLEPEPAVPRYIRTEPWVGYRFVADEN